MDKNKWRVKLRAYLRSLQESEQALKSRQACQQLVSSKYFQDASVVMMYLSIPYEADPSEAILKAWQLGKTVAVPKVIWEDKHMLPVQINSLEADFSFEVSGLRNPMKGIPVPFSDIDLIVTPGLGFDKKGNRLGRGGAYYDRFFAHQELQAQRCGFGFSEQLVDELPVTQNDQPMDFLVTDKQVLYFNNKKG
ncbi:MAG: 5-formyltetrahydrofolate cyclo-ligase [Planctomycetota bacterium]|jgi:5-formyltetrahydrofolate cyclo-ligase